MRKTIPETIGRPMEILLVEDSLTHARLAIGMLEKVKFKHRVTLVRDGLEALEFLFREGRFAKAPRPDLILLDLGLPKKDGREVLAELKSNFELQDVPVVVLTGSGADEDRARSEFLNVQHYLTKPINVENFVNVVKQLKRYWHADVILPAID